MRVGRLNSFSVDFFSSSWFFRSSKFCTSIDLPYAFLFLLSNFLFFFLAYKSFYGLAILYLITVRSSILISSLSLAIESLLFLIVDAMLDFLPINFLIIFSSKMLLGSSSEFSSRRSWFTNSELLLFCSCYLLLHISWFSSKNVLLNSLWFVKLSGELSL